MLEFPPIRLLKTSFTGIETEPKEIFNSNVNSNANVKRENRRVFRFLFCKLGFVCVVVCSSVILKNAIAFFNKMYRELNCYRLLDTIPPKSGTTRSDELICFTFLIYFILIFERKKVCDSAIIRGEKSLLNLSAPSRGE